MEAYMEILIGLIMGLILFIMLAVVFYAGYRLGKKNSIPIIPKSISQNPELTEDQKKRLELITQGWQNVLNYDVSTALQKKIK
jgi:uncharacterized protein YneF (UPF0154 family)